MALEKHDGDRNNPRARGRYRCREKRGGQCAGEVGVVPGLWACAVSQGIPQLEAAPEDWVYVCEEGNTQ